MTASVRAALAVLTALFVVALAVPAAGQGEGDGDTLPPDFRGTITYSGRHEGEVITAPITMRNYKPRPGTTSAATGRTREHSGTFNVELTFNGNQVTGRYSGTGGVVAGTYSGTHTGGKCRLVDGGGFIYQADCTRTRFSLESTTQDKRDTTVFRVEAMATKFVDAKVEEEKQRVAREEAAERARQAAAAYAALPSAGEALTKQLDGFVAKDSQGWAFNRYNAGSMSDVKITDGTTTSGNFVMQGYYTYNGGSRGWVMAKMAGGKLECIQFWDSVIGCRGLRTPEDGQMMRDAAIGAVAGALSDGPSSGKSAADCGRVAMGRYSDGSPIYGPAC